MRLLRRRTRWHWEAVKGSPRIAPTYSRWFFNSLSPWPWSVPKKIPSSGRQEVVWNIDWVSKTSSRKNLFWRLSPYCLRIQTLSIRTCVICVYLTNGENIALVVRTYEHFLFPCTQRGPPLFSLAGRSRLSSIWFSYMHTTQPDRHYIGCNNQLGKLLNKKHVIYLDLGICHSWRVLGKRGATCDVGLCRCALLF